MPDSFRADLFPLDLDRIEQEYLSMIHRIPSTEEVGLKDDFNGPICYTPDGNPLLVRRLVCETFGSPKALVLASRRLVEQAII